MISLPVRRALQVTLVTFLLGTGSDAAGILDSGALHRVHGLIQKGHYAEAEREARTLLTLVEGRGGAESIEAAEVIDHLVEALCRAGKAKEKEPEARELAERALRIKKRTLPAGDPGVAVSLTNLGMLLRDSGERAEAMLFFERALAIREKALGSDHPEVALSLNHVADLLRLSEQFAAAKPLYERALAISEKGLGPEHPDTALSLNNLASLLRDEGDFRAARPLFERAVAITEKAFGSGHPRLAWSLNSYAILLDEMGEYSVAKTNYERVLTICEKSQSLGPEHPRTAAALINLGILLKNMGEYAAARIHFERAVPISKKAFGANHPYVAKSQVNLADLLALMGNDETARPLYEQAIEIQQRASDAGSPEVAPTLRKLAGLLNRTGERDGARRLLERTLAIYQKTYGRDHDDIALTLIGLGDVFLQGGDYAAARSHYERALAIQEKIQGLEHPDVAQSLDSLSTLLRHTGEHARARQLLERSLVIRQKALGSGHPLVAESSRNLAQLLFQMGRFGEALDAALRAEQIGSEHLRLTARVLAEEQALRYASVRTSGLDLAASLAVATEVQSRGSARRVWDAVIRSRALVLDEVGARHRSVPEASPEARELAAASERLANLLVRGPGRDPTERHRRLLDEARRDREHAEQALARASAAFRQEQVTGRLTLVEVAQSLPLNSALVAFLLYDRHGAGASSPAPPPVPSYLAFVMRKGKSEPSLVPLGTAAELESLVTLWKQEASRGVFAKGKSPEQAVAAYRKVGEAIRSKIWDPIVPHVGDPKRVFVIFDGSLNLVSLAALPVGTAEYVIESGPLIHYLSTERDLFLARTPRTQSAGLLSLGGPDYDERSLFSVLGTEGDQPDPGSPVRMALAAPLPAGRTACGDLQSIHFKSLPGSAAEAQEIVSLWKRKTGARDDRSHVIHLSGADASEAAFKSMARGRRVLHLATHGFFMGRDCQPTAPSSRGIGGLGAIGRTHPYRIGGELPPLSGLALAGANHRMAAIPGEEDGILTAEEVAAMDLSGVEWAVLSACDTATGEVQAGEGVFGLRRAFQMAGVRTLIMTLWPVEDQSARQWMRALYDGRLGRGLDTAQAVREASLNVLRDLKKNGTTHPFYWAGFVAAGDWR